MEIAIIDGYANFQDHRALVGGRMVLIAALDAASLKHGEFVARKSWGVTTPDADGWLVEFSTVEVEASAAEIAAAIAVAGIEVQLPEAPAAYAARCRNQVAANAAVLGLEAALRIFREVNRHDSAAIAAVEAL